jgi:hypothetical protein
VARPRIASHRDLIRRPVTHRDDDDLAQSAIGIAPRRCSDRADHRPGHGQGRRWRTRGRPPALAGLLGTATAIAGAPPQLRDPGGQRHGLV